MSGNYDAQGNYQGPFDPLHNQSLEGDIDSALADRLRRSLTSNKKLPTAAAGVMQIPSMIVQGVDLVARQAPATVEHVGSRVEEYLRENSQGGMLDRLNALRKMPVGEIIGKGFADAQFDSIGDLPGFRSGNSDKIIQEVSDIVQNAQKSDPNVNAEQLANEEINKRKSVIPRITDDYNRATEDLVGAPHAEDRNFIENVILNAAPAAVPGGAVGKVGSTVRNNVLSKLLEKTKVDGLDLLDPRTQNFTPGGIGLNAGISGAIGGALTPSDDAPSAAKPITADGTAVVFPDTVVKPDGGKIVAVDTSPTEEEERTAAQKADDTSALFTPALGISFLGLALSRGRVAPNSVMGDMASKAAGTTIDGGAGYKGVENSSVADTLKHSADEQTIVTKSLTDAGMDPKKAFETTSDGTAHVRHNVGNKVDQFRKSGVLDGEIRAPSILHIKNAKEQIAMKLGQEKAQALDTYIMAVQRQGDVDRMTFEAQRDIDDLTVRNAYLRQQVFGGGSLSRKQRDTMFEEMAANQQKILTRQDELNKVVSDIPEARPSVEQLDAPTIKKYIDEGNKIPEFVEVRDMLKKLADADLEMHVKHGLMDTETADYLRQFTYVNPLHNDEFGGATGIKRAWLNTKNALRSNENVYGDPGNAAIARYHGPMRAKNLSVDKENKVNQPWNFTDAWDLHMERSIRYVQRSLYQRKTVDAIMAQPNWQNVLRQYTLNGNPLWSRKALEKHLADGNLSKIKDDIIVVPRGNSMYQVLRPKDKLLYKTLQQAPLESWGPFRVASQIMRMGTTGSGRPGFAGISMGYDLKTMNFNRPRGTVMGSDALVDMLVNKATGRPISDTLANSIRAISTSYDPVMVPMALHQALTSYLRQNQLRIARAFEGQLLASPGIFKELARVPGAQPLIQKLTKDWVQNYNESFHSMLVRNQVIDDFEFSKMWQTTRDAERVINANIPRWMQAVGSPGIEAASQLMMTLRAMEGASRSLYASRNVQRIANKKYGGDWRKIPDAELKKLFREARTIGGDFARKPGSKGMQIADSSIPYMNVMLQTQRATWEGMKRDPLMFATMMSGAIIPYFMSDYFMSNWDDAAKQFRYNQTPDFKRVSTIVLPTMETMMEFVKTGVMPPFSRDKVYELMVMPEMRTFAGPVSEIMRTLGAYGPNSSFLAKDPGVQTFSTLLAESMKQSLGISGPPLVNAALAPQGLRMDLSGVFGMIPALAGVSGVSMNPFQQVPGYAREGAEDPTNLSSNFSKSTAAIVSTLLGASGTTGMEAYNTMTDNYTRGGKGLVESVMAGMQEIGQRERATFTRDAAPGLWRATEKVYRAHPMNAEVTNYRKAVGVVAGRNAKVTERTGIPILDQIAGQLRVSLRVNPENKRLLNEYRKLNKELQQIDANRLLSYDEREQMKLPKLREINNVNQQQMKHMRDMQERYARTFGDDYKKAFGVPFSYQDFSKRIIEADRTRKLRPVQ